MKGLLDGGVAGMICLIFFFRFPVEVRGMEKF